MGHLLLSHPIPKAFTKYGKEDVFEVVPHIEMSHHLGTGFCQELRGGHSILIICAFELSHCDMTISAYSLSLNHI